jgi:hypothetical protein
MKTKPIATYCLQEVDGWQKLPPTMVLCPPGKELSYCGFLRERDGVHFMASVKDLGAIQRLHVSIAPIRFYRQDWTDEEHQDHLFDISPEVIESFFPGRRFSLMPDDPRAPHVRHYFAILEADE